MFGTRLIWITSAVCITTARTFAVESAQPGQKCERLMQVSSPRLEVAEVEREVSRALADFFNENPRARYLFRTAFYGNTRDTVNRTLVAALQNIPGERRASVTKSILLEVLRNEYSDFRDFVERIIKSSLALNQGQELFELPTYASNDLLLILEAARAARNHVLTFRRGKGEFAILQDRSRNITRYYLLDDGKHEGRPISKSVFDLAFEWRKRSITQATEDWWMKAIFRFAFGASTPKLDQVQAYEETLSDYYKQIWRYTMNSLSDESYALVLYLLEQGMQYLEANLDPSEIGLVSYSLKDFAEGIWQKAKTLNYPLELNKEVYSDVELDAILSTFRIMTISMDSADIGYRIVSFEGKTLYFLKERTNDNQLIFRRKSIEEFEKSQNRGEEESGAIFTRYEPIPAITSNVDLEHLPERIVQIPEQHLAALNVLLNPGYASLGGFKQPNEDLSQLIQRDALAVTRRGYTHKSLADWLLKLMNLAEDGQSMVNLNGRKYEIVVLQPMGPQTSPFGDRFAWSRDYVVLDTETGERIRFSGGHPYMIGYYGFFEGNVPYRVEPDELIDLIEGRRDP